MIAALFLCRIIVTLFIHFIEQGCIIILNDLHCPIQYLMF